jgi:hypothetical protein
VIAALLKHTGGNVAHGTRKGAFLGRQAIGETVSFDTIDVAELADGRLVQPWHIEDFAGFFQRGEAEEQRMKTIVILRPGARFDKERFGALINDEERAVWRAQVSGELREILYNTAQFGSVILIYETTTVERARELTHDLPLVAQGLFNLEVLPTRPYDGLANLFKPDEDFRQTLPPEWTVGS